MVLSSVLKPTLLHYLLHKVCENYYFSILDIGKMKSKRLAAVALSPPTLQRALQIAKLASFSQEKNFTRSHLLFNFFASF